ncbi:vegetative incompatibility protein HET-E-1 [Fusarium oxysporum f. sp. phaseoli]
MEALGAAVNILSAIDLSAKVGLLCLEYAKAVKNAQTELAQLHREAVELEKALTDMQSLLEGADKEKLKSSQRLNGALKDSVMQLQMLEKRLHPSTSRKAMSRIGLRALKWPFESKEIDLFITNLRKNKDIILLTLQVDQTALLLEVNSTLSSLDQKWVLSRLQIAAGASFDSQAEEHNPTCLPNTRVDLLNQISEWVKDSKSQKLFWLNGMAGTGKSTVARTLAQSFSQSGHLGASFFFKRGESDRDGLSKFVSTICAQLVESRPTLALHIKATIDSDPHVFDKTTREQFSKMIVQAFSSTTEDPRNSNPTVIIIDALDECVRQEDVELIIHLFSHLEPSRIKVFLTSRPELHIRISFNSVQGTYDSFTLHEIPRLTIYHDISIFLSHELARIRMGYNLSVSEDRKLPPDWPGELQVQTLTEMAVPLFIFAATVSRFLADRRLGSPNDQLQEVLQYQAESRASQLDATYLPILNKLVSGLWAKQKEKVIKRFRETIGSIIILRSPLSRSALGRMLELSRDVLDGQLEMLHSVLDVPPDDSPVRIFHASFRDFLIDPEKSESWFWIDTKQAHRYIALRCLNLMEKNLRKDICNINRPGTSRLSIQQQVINVCLPLEVQYSCLYWAHHMRQAGMVPEDDGDAHKFLSRHFLHWLEALSLTGLSSWAPKIIQDLQSVLPLEGNTNLAQLLQDAMRLTLANLPIIDSHPLQLYSSVLAFAPKNSIIRQLFQHYMLELFSLVPETQDDWDGCLQVLEGHDNWVTCVSFSENSKILASGSNDRTVRLWLVDSGQCLWELHGHERPIVSVTFSQDSKLLASVSEDGDAQLWSVDSGKCIKELNRYDDWVTSVAFSFGSRLIVSTRQDQTIRLWETGNEGSSQVYKGHEGWVENVVLSPQSGLAASYSDNIVHIWRIANGQLLRDLRGHADRVTLVSFSRDSTLLASSSYDKTVRVWRVDNGDCVQILRYKATVKALTFFPSSRLLVTAIYSEIQVWDIATGECIQELSGHRDWVTHVAFSPDSKLMASASEDETVRLWQVGDDERIRNKNSSDGSILAWTVSTNRALIASVSNDHVQLWRTDNGECTQKLKGHDDSILSVTFSPNTRFLASSSYDGTVRLWKVDTGECLQTLEGHVRFATSMAFSADSKRLATSSWEEFIRLWDVSSGICTQIFEGHTQSITAVVFSSDSRLIASSSHDRSVRLWRVDDGQCIRTLKGNMGPTTSVAFSIDSMFVALASSSDGSVSVWRVDNGQCIKRYTCNANSVKSIAFAADLTLLACISDFGTIILWQNEASQPIQEITVSASPSHLEFEPGNDHIITDTGSICIHGRILSDESTTHAPIPHSCGYHMSGDRCWLMWQESKILWLPASYRARRSIILGSTVATTSTSGRLVIFRLPDREPLQ